MNKSIEDIIEELRECLRLGLNVSLLSAEEMQALVSYFDDLKTFENSI